MTASLEARLVISAQDRTKEAFDAILRRLDGVLERARGLGRVSEVAGRAISQVDGSLGRVERSLGSAARTMETAARSMERAAAAMARAAHGIPGAPAMPGFGGGSRAAAHGRGRAIAGALAAGRSPGHVARHSATHEAYGVGGVGGAVAAYTGFEVGEKTVEESAIRQHERIRMEIAGMSPAVRKEAEARAAELAGQFPMIDQTSIMHTLRNARSITNSYDDASAMAADILRMRIVAQAAKPDRDIESETDALLKGMELHGDTQNRASFHDAIGRITKTLAIEGDTLTPETIYSAIKTARQALPSASGRFLFSAAPALMQDMGASFGTALSSFNRAVVTGRMDSKALPSALDLGLIAKEDVEFDKHGAPVRVKPLTKGGHGFKDWQLASSDPDEYIYNRLMPALKQHGFDDPQKAAQVLNLLLSNRMAGVFALAFATQRSRIEKNQANLAGVPDDPAAVIMGGDPTAAYQGVKNAFANLAAATDASGHGLTAALNALATAIDDKAAQMQGVKTAHVRLTENQQKYGLDSSQDLTAASPDDLAGARQKAIEEGMAKIAAAKLEMKGLVDEIHRRNGERHGLLGWFGFGGEETASLVGRVHQLKSLIADLQAAMDRAKTLGEGLPALRPGREDDPAFRTRTGVAAIPGFSHASFPLGSTYGHVDPSTGQDTPSPAVSPYGGLGHGMATAPVKAEVTGNVQVLTSFELRESSSFVSLVKRAEKVISDSALFKAGAASDGRSFGMNVGSGAPDAGTSGRGP